MDDSLIELSIEEGDLKALLDVTGLEVKCEACEGWVPGVNWLVHACQS